jgi:hypothetical protein
MRNDRVGLHFESLEGDKNKESQDVQEPKLGPRRVFLLGYVRNLDIDCVVCVQERIEQAW